MNYQFIISVVILIAAQSQTTNAPAPCAQYLDCPTCVSHHLCGWCSEPVIYPDNKTGTQCAGFDPNGTLPFSCNGIYSTDQCVQGYICNLATFTCDLGPPGSGSTLADCEANCTNKGQVYLCNTTTMQCYEVPRGTPGAASYDVCMASCTHPSPHPASPAPPPAQVYACNYTDGKCYPTDPGKGSSLQVCQESCQQTNGSQYMCNTFLSQCILLPPGVKGETLAQCEAQCNPKPTPGPPSDFEGVWRGIAIQNNFKSGEWDLNISQSLAIIVDIVGATTIKGIPYTRKSASGTLELWILIKSGPGAGKYIKAIGQKANRGPETYFFTAAFGAVDAPAPASINTAMTDGKSKVFFLGKCTGTPECVFTMPSGIRELHSKKMAVSVDPCSQYSDTCQNCLAHPLCGWCSTDVIYKDGEKGTQCAGFSTNENVTNPFICNGRYSTFNCSQGYDCDFTTDTCTPDPTPGNGYPLDVCTELCRPTPAPSPPPQQYVCNITSRQCYKCDQKYCPGSMPLSTCEAACVKPKPGPSGLVIGIWRGIQIQNYYPLNEYQYVFNSSGISVYFMNKLEWTGSVISLGGDLMIIDVLTGPNKGKRLSSIYTIQNQGDPLYEIMTLAVGLPDGPIPSGYAEPMATKKEYELIMAKCNGTPCKFPNP